MLLSRVAGLESVLCVGREGLPLDASQSYDVVVDATSNQVGVLAALVSVARGCVIAFVSLWLCIHPAGWV